MFNKLKALSKSLSPVQRAIDTALDTENMTASAAVAFLADWLPQQQGMQEQSGKLFELLNGIDPVCQKHFNTLLTELMRGQLTRLRLHLFASSTAPFIDAMYQSYLRCVNQYKSTLMNQNASPHAGLLWWAGRRLEIEFITTHQAQNTRWTEIYACAPLILQNKLPTQALSAAKLELAHFCLVATGLASELEVRQVEILNRLSRSLAPFVNFEQKKPMGLCYVLSMDEEQPPIMVTDETPVSRVDNIVYLNYERVLDELRSLEYLIGEQAQLPNKLNYDDSLQTTEVLVTIKLVRDKWMGKVKTRRHERRKLGRDAEIAYEFPTIRVKLSGSEHFQLKTATLGLGKGVLQDISQSGVGLTIPNATWAKVGLAIGMQVAGSPKWVVGVIRRVTALEAENSLLLGIEVLSLAPLSIRLVEEAKISVWETSTNVAAFDNIFGIWIPASPHSHGQAMIMLESKNVSIGKTYGIYFHGEKAMVRIIELAEIGANFYRFNVEITSEFTQTEESSHELDF
ncbi:hypothetical protein [Leeia oryzae]|uniref:hypothetical protein n=1 Tax=Leeia oryzae TaxID=356662 RepID=UPI00037F1F62|nr:hypothetical protein [Leeia oryzae]